MAEHSDLISDHSPAPLMEKSLYPVLLLFVVVRERTKNIDVTEISRDIYEAEKAQDKANDDLEAVSQDRDMTRDQVEHVKIENISQISVT